MSVLEPFNPRHAARAVLELASDNVLPELITSAILDVHVPRIDMRYDEGKALELKRMSRLERVFDALLQDHNVMAVSDHGGIRVIPPADQVDTSHTRGLRRLDGVLRGMMQEARYVDVAGFTNAQVAEQRDYAAWLDQLRRALVPNGRTLKHALAIDTRFNPQPVQGRPRPRIVYPVGDE